MSQIYLIPDRKNLDDSLALRREEKICWEYNDFIYPEILSDRKKQSEIIDEYAGAGVDFSQDTMHGAFFDITLHSSDPLIRDVSEKRVRQSMVIAREMGLRGVVFHSNRIQNFRDEPYLKNWLNANEAFFRGLAEEFPDTGIYMENMFDEAPDMLLLLAERLRDVPKFALCVDYGHAAVSGYPPGEWLKRSAPYTAHIHINDNDLKNDMHWVLGEGQIDWKRFAKELYDDAIDVTILIEVKGVERQKKSLAYLRDNGLASILGGDGK